MKLTRSLELVKKATPFIYFVAIVFLSISIYHIRYPDHIPNANVFIPHPLGSTGEQVLTEEIHPDPLQMAYLIRNAKTAMSEGYNPLTDPYSFASIKDVFRPLVLDPLVYLGGVCHLFIDLPLSYNVALVFFPLVLYNWGIFLLLRYFKVDPLISLGISIAAAFFPYRVDMAFKGQHIAYSISLLPYFLLFMLRSFDEKRESVRDIMLASFFLLLLSFSEEHLAYQTILFSGFFILVALYLIYKKELHWRWLSVYGGSHVVIVAYAVFQKYLISTSLDQRKYSYSFLKKYTAHYKNFAHRFFYGPDAYVPLITIGILVFLVIFAYLIYKKRFGSRRDILVSALMAIFLICGFLSLGHRKHLGHFNLYRLLYKYLPYFKLQRYPERMMMLPFTVGYIFSGIGYQQLLDFVKNSKVRQGIAVLFLLLSIFSAGAFLHKSPGGRYWSLGKTPYEELFAAITENTAKEDIILALPFGKANQYFDAMTNLYVLKTDRRFFNGYFSFTPRVYAENLETLQHLIYKNFGGNTVAALNELGVTYLLIDKEELVNIEKLQEIDGLLNSIHFEVLRADDKYVFGKLKE